MNVIKSLIPLITFILIFLFSGIYFWVIGEKNPFYIISPNIAIIPALLIAWYLSKIDKKSKINNLIKGASHPDIILMCAIFLSSGVFAQVTHSIGSVTAVVNFIQNIIPPKFLIVSFFLTSAAVSTSIGSSMGTIATLGPIFYNISSSNNISLDLSMGTLVGGAMFGDNLSLVSDTTICATNSQGANPLQKLKLNLKYSLISASITILILLLFSKDSLSIKFRSLDLILLSPYIILFIMAILQFDVIFLLLVSIFVAFIVGVIKNNYTIINFIDDTNIGFAKNYSLVFLTTMLGGLWQLVWSDVTSLEKYFYDFSSKITRKKSKLLIALLVSLLDMLIANNVVAIIVSGKFAKIIAKKNNIKPNEVAVILDTFSCIVQGIIPYGAQVLLASTIASISPIKTISKVYYCFILAFVSIFFIVSERNTNDNNN